MSTPKEPAKAPTTTVATGNATTPEIKVTVQDAPKHRTPERDAQDALAGRLAIEKEKADANQALMDAGKVVAPGPITAYEHERAKLGTVPEDAPATEPAEDK